MKKFKFKLPALVYDADYILQLEYPNLRILFKKEYEEDTEYREVYFRDLFETREEGKLTEFESHDSEYSRFKSLRIDLDDYYDLKSITIIQSIYCENHGNTWGDSHEYWYVDKEKTIQYEPFI